MSNPKFMVFKLKDLRIPLIILMIAAVLFVFLLFRNKAATQTFAPSDTYQDGKYIAGISLSDAEMDLVVEVKDNKITSVSLEGLDEKTSALYKDLAYGIDYVNTYVTATQSLDLPQSTNTSAATTMLMDAVKVALSSDKNTQISSTYEKVNLMDTNAVKNVSSNDPDQKVSKKNAEINAVSEEPKQAKTDEKTSTEASPHTSIIEEEVIEQ